MRASAAESTLDTWGIRQLGGSRAMSPTHTQHPHASRVVIAGAGVAALEAMLALRSLAGREVAIRVLTPGESFLHRPASVADSFSADGEPDLDLGAILTAARATRTVDLLDGVDAAQHTICTRSGDTVPYDELLIAVGARRIPAVAGALAFRGHADVPALRQTIAEIETRRISHLAFALPDGNAWPVPLYELAVMAATHATAHRSPARITVVTAETTPLECFGEQASAATVGLLADHGVEVVAGASPLAFHSGVLELAGGTTIAADRVVALPRLAGPAIAGLPADGDGFIPIDCHGRVEGLEGVYAAGDATAGALKSGTLAAAQADAIAELIAERAGAPVTARPFAPIVRGLLLADVDPLYVRVESLHGRGAAVPIHGDSLAPLLRARSRHRRGSRALLWWPPARATGRHLAPWLAGANGRPLVRPRGTHRNDYAVDLMLLLADCDAWAGDHPQALQALDCAESLGGALPSQYSAKRRCWAEHESAEPAGTPGAWGC